MDRSETAQERLSRGVLAIGQLVGRWLVPLSQERMATILEWAYGERTGIVGGQLSRLRNARHIRPVGLKYLDSLAEANRAIWTWQTQGPEAAIRQFGLHSNWGVQPEWLDAAVWLPRPDDAGQPLDLGDLAMVAAGRLTLPYLGEAMSPAESSHATRELSDLLQDLAREQGWAPREAMEAFTEAYPSQSAGRQQMLKRIVLGDALLSPGELELELAALAEMIRVIRGDQVGSYGPAELRAELLSARRSRG